MNGAMVVAGHAVRESLRRRVFLVVLILSVVFLLLYTWGAAELFAGIGAFDEDDVDIETDTLAGGTLLGLAMFAIMFLGAVLATFLTIGAVRGDAERGLLQPVIVRPLGRTAYLAGRLLAAAGVSAVYVIVLFAACLLVTGALGWWPDRIVTPALTLAGAAVVIASLAMLGSVLLSTTANGIMVFMAFGAGLTAGLLGQIGDALNSRTLDRIGDVGAWLLPFEALYQHGLASLTADTTGTTEIIVNLGPFGGAQAGGALMWPYALAYLAAVTGLAAYAFSRRDL
ncbi:MAG TPA: ABC transporter permease [Solirubrobacteraceae bacterium]|nr:ABC transporter permease [Solirubrobacteraceae bacterium]